MAAERSTPELATPELVTTQLSNGLSCDLPANSPLAKMLRSQRTWIRSSISGKRWPGPAVSGMLTEGDCFPVPVGRYESRGIAA